MRRRRRGYILIQALVAIVALLALMATLSADLHANLGVLQAKLSERRAGAAAQSAIARAEAVLESQNTGVVTSTDDWARQGNAGQDIFQFNDGSATYRMQIIDAGSLINVNTAAQAQLLLLPLQQDQVDTLLDWREASTTPRTDGAKDEFYNALPQPYNTKLGPLDTLNELLLIDNWTAQTLYQPPTSTTTTSLPVDQNGQQLPLASLLTVDSGTPNTQADGTARINVGTRGVSLTSLTALGINRNLATLIASRAPFTNYAGLLALPGMNTQTATTLLNSVTFSTNTRSQGLINLNTASQTVLQTVPSLSTDLATAIVTQQSLGFQTLGALAAISGMTVPILSQVADSFTIGSDTWIVRVYGQSGGFSEPIEAVVGIRNSQMQVINVDRLHTTGVPTWWNWTTQTGNPIDAGVSE